MDMVHRLLLHTILASLSWATIQCLKLNLNDHDGINSSEGSSTMSDNIKQSIMERILQNDCICSHTRYEIERALASCPPAPPIPIFLLSNSQSISIPRRVKQIQQFIIQFEYNHTGIVFFATKRNRGMKHLVYTAKLIMKEALPIQCVEAVFLAVHLTNGMKSLLRLPLCFKSRVRSSEHDHIVLAIYDGLAWGALGISRLENLMYKSLKFSSLNALLIDFIHCYRQYRHEVTMISIGLPFSHNDCSEVPIQWKVLNILIDDTRMNQTADALDRYTRDCSFIFDFFSRTGRYPEFCTKDYLSGK